MVGGGINGTSIAYNLARRGLQVTLIEKTFVAGGPTGRSSAIVRQHYSNTVTARMALRSLRIWQNFEDAVGGDAGFVETGFLLGARPQDLDGVEANIALQQAVGINTRFVSAEELKALEPYLSIDGLVGAAYEPESGYADPAAAATAYANAAKRLGASTQIGTRVTSIQTTGGRVSGVITDKGEVSAGAVVLAAGPWTPLLAHTVGVELPITASRHQVCLYRWPPGFQERMVYADFVDCVYMRPETGRLMLVGSVEPEEAEDRVDDPDHFSESVAFDTVADFVERVTHRYPDMEQGFSTGGYAALYDITPDWHPIIDELPGLSGLYCCAGTSGHGFKLGPAVGEMVAAMVVDGKQPEDDVNLFSFERFASGNLVRGQYEYSIVG